MDALIRRSEVVERAAWSDLYRGAAKSVQEDLGLEAVEQRGMTFLSATQADHLLLNRAIGLGSEASCDHAAIAESVAHYRQRGIERFWFHLSSDQRYSELPGLLRLEGIVLYPRSWMKFVRTTSRNVRSADGLDARAARPSDAAQVSEIVGAAFDLPGQAGRLFATALELEDWHLCVVEGGQRIVAAGALFVQGEDGYLAFAGTRPEARRRGCQRALMEARIDLTARLGCRRVFTETGLPVRGEPNSSYRNLLRLGFDELCVRDNFAPEDAKWSNHPSSDANRNSAASEPPSRRPMKGAARFGS